MESGGRAEGVGSPRGDGSTSMGLGAPPELRCEGEKELQGGQRTNDSEANSGYSRDKVSKTESRERPSRGGGRGGWAWAASQPLVIVEGGDADADTRALWSGNRARLYRWERVHAADRQERSGNERTQEQSHRRRTVAAQLA